MKRYLWEGCDAGQALLELVVVMPLLLVLLVGIMQLALVCRTNLMAHMAVRHAVEMHWQGRTKKQIQAEIARYFQRYPVMQAQEVCVQWKSTFFDETIEISIDPPLLPGTAWLKKKPTVTASLTVAREIFSLNRLPTANDIRSFKRKLNESR
ncbi:MAG: hypothetical protein GX316_02985 [Firmicutes bacterium]|nr:hypothetical protein [Bacillota bacterium]